MTSLRIRSAASSTTPAQGDDRDLRPPQAVRARASGWRDPRLVVGVVIVAGCVLLGARVLAAADDTVAVWSVRTDLPAGSRLSGDDLAPVQVRLGAGADRYLGAETAPAPGSTLVRDVDAGELLPRSAVAASGAPTHLEVPLSVAPDDVPGSVRPGAIVDVWVTPTVAGPGDARPRARLALDDVIVVAVPSGGDSLAPRTTRQVIVGVDENRSGEVAEALGLMADGRVVLIRQSRS